MKLNPTGNIETNSGGGDHLFSSSLVGDGGATWRLKALERVPSPLADIQNNRKRGPSDDDKQTACKRSKPTHHPNMLIPRPGDSLTWGNGISHRRMSTEDAGRVSSTLGRLNKFPDDGSFKPGPLFPAVSGPNQETGKSGTFQVYEDKLREDAAAKPAMSANQIAAKVMQLSMKGKHQEAESLLKQTVEVKARSSGGGAASRTQEAHKRLLTQQDRCQSCFENPSWPRHLVISIANFVYLMLPQWKPLVPGHCCILPTQHEGSTRNIDKNVWDEIRNFKKCLILMFAKQDKEVVFIETVTGLAQQRHHCLIECIPLPQAVAKQAPLYFKKAIEEAEDEWIQHAGKRLIDTSLKGLCGSIPKDFPYFHVEFGLDRGFVHVIEDETHFKGNFGLNVIRGLLKLPAEDMYSRRKSEPVHAHQQAVRSFIQKWEQFDWTKQLD